MSSDTEMSPMPAPRYARFSRRLRAMLVDWIITLIVMFGAVLLAASVGNDNFSRGLGILAVVVLVLYEPILVSRMGGTLGHSFTNLRVVDDQQWRQYRLRDGPAPASSSRACWGCTPS